MAARRTDGLDSRRMRRLNEPNLIEVRYNRAGQPVAVQHRPPRGAWLEVKLNRKPWRIDQHWWRGPGGHIGRTYYEVDPGNAPVFTVYLDEATGVWYRQHYSAPEEGPPTKKRPLPPSKPWSSPTRR